MRMMRTMLWIRRKVDRRTKACDHVALTANGAAVVVETLRPSRSIYSPVLWFEGCLGISCKCPCAHVAVASNGAAVECRLPPCLSTGYSELTRSSGSATCESRGGANQNSGFAGGQVKASAGSMYSVCRYLSYFSGESSCVWRIGGGAS